MGKYAETPKAYFISHSGASTKFTKLWAQDTLKRVLGDE